MANELSDFPQARSRGFVRLYDLHLWSDKIALAYRMDGIRDCTVRFYRPGKDIEVSYRLTEDAYKAVNRAGWYSINDNVPEIVVKKSRMVYYEDYNTMVKNLIRHGTGVKMRPERKGPINLRTFDAALWAPVFVDVGYIEGAKATTRSKPWIIFRYPSDMDCAYRGVIEAPPIPANGTECWHRLKMVGAKV